MEALRLIASEKEALEAEYQRLQAVGGDTSALEARARELLAQEAAMQQHTIVCFSCGMPVAAGEMQCQQCLLEMTDKEFDVSTASSIMMCRSCERYEAAPGKWLVCEWESKELLALCLRRFKKPKDVRLVDARLLYTEPHSRRVLVEVKLEKEVNKFCLQKTLKVVYVVATRQCEQCTKSMTPHIWVSCVQVRQRAPCKRTMFLLEQLILKFEMNANCSNIVDTPDGLDFHFAKPQHAAALVQFIRSHLCCKVHPTACQMIGHDLKSNIFRNKYITILELCPINRGDLVYVPKKIASQLGGISSLMICDNVCKRFSLIDPLSLRNVDLDSERFFKYHGNGDGLRALTNVNNVVPFMVLNSELVNEKNIVKAGVPSRFLPGEGAAANVLTEVEMCKLTDLGTNERYINTTSHLGRHIKAGDIVLGYDIKTTNAITDSDPELNQALDQYPVEAIIIRKQATKKVRNWEFQHLPRDVVSKHNRPTDQDQLFVEADMDQFIEDLQNVTVG